MEAFAVKSPVGIIDPERICETAKDAIDNFCWEKATSMSRERRDHVGMWHAYEAQGFRCVPVQITEGWIPVGERLPDLVSTDDEPCHVGSDEIEAISYSEEVLVEIEGSHGRRIDRFMKGVISGNSAWEIYGKRVTHWQPLPPPPKEGK